MYGKSVFFNALTQERKKEVLEQYADEATAKFWWYVQGLEEGLGLESVRGVKKLELYRQRLPETWASISDLDPSLYEKQMKEWHKLEEREMKKEPAKPTIRSIRDLRIPGIDEET